MRESLFGIFDKTANCKYKTSDGDSITITKHLHDEDRAINLGYEFDISYSSCKFECKKEYLTDMIKALATNDFTDAEPINDSNHKYYREDMYLTNWVTTRDKLLLFISLLKENKRHRITLDNKSKGLIKDFILKHVKELDIEMLRMRYESNV